MPSKVEAVDKLKKKSQDDVGAPMIFELVEFVSGLLRVSQAVDSEVKREETSNEKEEEKIEAEVNMWENIWDENNAVEESRTIQQITQCHVNVHLTQKEKSGSHKHNLNFSGGLSSNANKGKFTVGLVGKPSAGKSTIFNCVTAEISAISLSTDTVLSLTSDSRSSRTGLAKVGAHPFTTILRNFGSGWWFSTDEGDMAKDVVDTRKEKRSETEFGRDFRGRRILPLLVKDVAGLIPGAYKGL